MDLLPNDGDAFGDDFPDGALEDTSPKPQVEYFCKICKEKLCQPRLLSCLHTFCEKCIDKLISDESANGNGHDHTVACPICEQETKVAGKKAADLPSNYVMNNLLDMCAIRDMTVVCTSCKTKENAVSRCSDCANFLCSNCNTAHQFMRCFENHHVVPFEELRQQTAGEEKDSVPIHKPIYCSVHPTECLKLYCHSCRIPICNDCVLSDHVAPHHRYERLTATAPTFREEIESLAHEVRRKSSVFEVASSDLDNALTELQAQRDAAQDLIKETFQSYKAFLEMCQEDLLKELHTIHKQKELRIMGSYHMVEKTMDKVDDACKFTSRLLRQGNNVEIVSLGNIVIAQLHKILATSPEPEVNTSIEFVTDGTKFQAAVKATFGALKCQTITPEVPTSTDTMSAIFPPPPPPPGNASIQIVPQSLMARDDSSPSPTFSTVSSNGERTTVPGTGRVQSSYNAATTSSLLNGYASSVTSSPVSSYDSEISQITGYGVTAKPETPTAQSPSMSSSQNALCAGLTSIQEYNLTQLASLADKVDMEGHPTLSSNPTSPMSFNDILSGNMGSQNQALKNLQALAKLGGMSIGDHDMNPESLNGGSGLLGRPSPPSTPMGLTSPTLSSKGNNFPILSETDEPILSSHSGSFPMNRDGGKVMAMDVRLKFGTVGNGKGQFSSPHGFCLGCDEDIVVADTNNHRIQVFDKMGQFKFQFGVAGKEEGQLFYPRKVAVIRNSGKFVVCDRGNERSRLQIFTKNGHFVRKIAIRYIEILAGLAVTQSGHIVAVDSVSPTVFVISETGGISSWFNCSDYMMEPSDITVSGREFYVCDFKGHAVVVFDEDGKFKRRIGREPITHYPNGIEVSDAGDVVVGDSHGNRFHVVVFNKNGEQLSEFECPHVKVSRCCGLKITSDGYVVTLAKNNHCVLVLNTLYVD
ncbi:brain tumor protein-like isoform X2 [Thrips palmi]|uniref:Brain tumor protein-like isoform X2 n=1 Tax=Thrips palmi TaxID=161013 RepID=A0A6P8Z9V3_THRPL|nr:brain tumor protein-like isoform X2 [Thrips palmi]